MSAFHVAVEGPGLTMSRDVDEATAAMVVEIVLGSPRWHAAGGSIARPSARRDLRVLFDEIEPSNNPERIALIAYYVTTETGSAGLPRIEIPRWFIRAGETPPRNLSRDLQLALEDELVVEADEEGRVLLPGPSFLAPGSERQSESVDRPGSKRTPRGTRGPADYLRELIRRGWFSMPRSSKDIVEELRRKGHDYGRTDLTRQLLTLTQNEELYRRKGRPPNSKRTVWLYSAQQEDLFADDAISNDAANI